MVYGVPLSKNPSFFLVCESLFLKNNKQVVIF